MKEAFSKRHEIIINFDRVKGEGDQDELYRHYLKLQLRKLEEEQQSKIEVDTKANAAADNQ